MAPRFAHRKRGPLRRLWSRVAGECLLLLWPSPTGNSAVDDSQPGEGTELPGDGGTGADRDAGGLGSVAPTSHVGYVLTVYARRCGCCRQRALWKIAPGVTSCDFCDLYPSGDADAELAVTE